MTLSEDMCDIDIYTQVLAEVCQSTRDLECLVGGFFKERRRIEGEYVRNIRGLIKTYSSVELIGNKQEGTNMKDGFR